MSAAAFFNAARAYKREATGEATAALTQQEVDALNAVAGPWERAGATTRPEPAAAGGLGDAAAFYKALRASFGSLTQPQADGFAVLLSAISDARWPIAWAAKGLATAWWETNKTMQPVKEAYWLSEEWRKKNLRYFPWYGRGYVQLTWEANYRKAGEELGLGESLIADPDLALRPDIASRILVAGMEQGWFTSKKLADYLPIDGAAGFDAFKAARRIINGQDKATEIAKIAQSFQAALREGAWT